MPSLPATMVPAAPQAAPPIAPALRILDSSTIDLLAKRLELSDDQKIQVQNILKQAEQDIRPLADANWQATQQFVNLLKQKEPDMKALEGASKKIAETDQAILMRKVQSLVSIRTVLTPEQDTILAEIIEQRTRAFNIPKTP